MSDNKTSVRVEESFKCVSHIMFTNGSEEEIIKLKVIKVTNLVAKVSLQLHTALNVSF